MILFFSATMNDMTTEYVAAFDAGTTALKGALVNGQGCIVASASSELDLIINGDYREPEPRSMVASFLLGLQAHD